MQTYGFPQVHICTTKERGAKLLSQSDDCFVRVIPGFCQEIHKEVHRICIIHRDDVLTIGVADDLEVHVVISVMMIDN